MTLDLSDSMNDDAVMPRRKTKGTLGGWRPGAGRKAILKDRVRFTLDLERADLAELERAATTRGQSVAAVIRDVLARYLGRERRK
jgi:hypothetical protein